MKITDIERRIVVSSRYLTSLAVIGSLAGAVLMFLLGIYNIGRAFAEGVEGLDRFLIAIVLLYFGYGVYTLFLHPEESEKELNLPQWLQVKQIGQLKQVVAEVIIVVLLVLFLRLALQAFHSPDVALIPTQIATLMILPVSILLLSLALYFVELHPKPGANARKTGNAVPDEQADAEES